MVTIEETISTFERHHELDEQNRLVILSALRAQRKREKGCEYCKDGAEIEYRFDIRGGNQLYGYDGDGCDISVTINFCPMCGRKLGENDG